MKIKWLNMKLLEDAQDEHVRMELKVRLYEEKKRRQEEQERFRREKKMAEKGSEKGVKGKLKGRYLKTSA